MMRDLTYAELFLGGDAESKLVAESLAATLRRIQDFEDGVEYETPSETGHPNLSLPAPCDGENQSPMKDEDATTAGGDENTGGIRTLGDSAPTKSNTVDELDDGGDANGSTSNDFTDGSDDVKTTMVANAPVLRMQPRLMRVVSFSQERCLDLWTNKSEPHYRNATFISLMQGVKRDNRGKQGQNGSRRPLTEAQIQLYEDLVRQRAYVARRAECLPGFLCSLDDLAFVAWGRPTNIEALRVISYFLPEALHDTNGGVGRPVGLFLDQMFHLTRKSLKADNLELSPFDKAVRRHCNTKIESKESQERWSFLRRALAASAIGGIVLVAITIVRKRRQ